jgi:hypothetical protein
MEEWMKKEWMLKELERIWPEGKGSTIYKLIETKDEYKEESNSRFEMLFKQSVMKYDYDMETSMLWGCEPTPHDITSAFLLNIAKAIGQCFVGQRKKLYETIAKDLYTLDLLYKPILEIESEMSCSGVPEPSTEDCLKGKKLEF